MSFKITLLLVFFFQLSFSQYFSGEIVYESEIIPKNENVNVDSIVKTKQGTKAIYVITDRYYKSTYYKNESWTYSYIYHDETKRMYDDYTGSSYITFRDSQKANYKYGQSEIFKDSTKNILGRKCYLVKSKSNYGDTDTYYSNKIAVNSESFKGHKVGNWYNKLKQVNGAISLYTKTEFKDYYEIRKAVEINRREVLRNEFDLPFNKQVVASFNAVDKKPEMIQPSPNVIDCFKSKMIEASKKKGDIPQKTIYIKFILTKNGKIEEVEPVEEDIDGLYKVGIDVIKNCGLTFISGEIEGNRVSTQVVFPLTL